MVGTIHKLIMVGTIHKNKREISPQFSQEPQKRKGCEAKTDFCFTTCFNNSNSGITVYNKTKDRVDTVDQLCCTYDVSQNSRRWPFTIFFSLMNVTGIMFMWCTTKTHVTHAVQAVPEKACLRPCSRTNLPKTSQKFLSQQRDAIEAQKNNWWNKIWEMFKE